MSNTFLFVLFLVLFRAAPRRLHCPLAFFPQSDRCAFPLKNFRHPALAHYLLVRPTIVAATASMLFVHPVPKTPDTHIIS